MSDFYRYSIDPFLLSDFCGSGLGRVVADLGTGTGILPVLICHLSTVQAFHAIEVQKKLIDESRQQVQARGLADRVNLHAIDVRQIDGFFSPQSCDSVITNPPYRVPGTGKLAPLSERAAARHELHGGLDDFLKAAAYLLGDGGRFYIVYLAERLTDLLEGMRRHRLEPKRMRCVHGRVGDVAKMVLVEGRKGGRPGIKLEAPLIVYEGEAYTPEVQAIYDRFRELWD